jgi:hypothetical protein
VHVYDRVERTYGDTFVRNLMSFLSIARFGLREKDLQALVGAASGNDWLPSSFAAVRRALRAHLCERGRSGQWAFTHHQARSAATDRYSATPETASPLPQALARHFLTPASHRDASLNHNIRVSVRMASVATTV